MDLYWTSISPIKGLRHFVCVNEIKHGNDCSALLVSAIDIEVNLKVSKEELDNSGLWQLGWLDISKSEAITKEYISFKKSKNFSIPTKLLLDVSSPFYLI